MMHFYEVLLRKTGITTKYRNTKIIIFLHVFLYQTFREWHNDCLL